LQENANEKLRKPRARRSKHGPTMADS